MQIHRNPAGRKALANLFKGIGVELGTERGKYAEELAQVADKLYVVDLWKAYGDYRQHVSDDHYSEIKKDAHRRLDKYEVGFIQEDTVKAAELFLDNYIDAIYVDANHTEEAAYNDLVAWYPKVKSGGIIAGHDWKRTKDFGVIEAVTRFASEKGIEEITIWEGDRTPSWHLVKP